MNIIHPYLPENPLNNFFLLAGPCVIESKELSFEIAEYIDSICKKLQIPYVFKASYRKANRTKASSFTGIGDQKALEILKEIGEKYKVPTVTDIHETTEAQIAADFVDILQIPAFLCRQTELIAAAAKTGKIVNIKKGQFLSGGSMKFAVEKAREFNKEAQVLLTERGNSFGYTDLVVDYTNIIDMQEFKVPVIMDCTHSLQRPNQNSGVTGGNPKMISTIAKAAIAVGADGLFIETHPDPANAKSDGANMLKLDLLENLLIQLVSIRQTINSF